MTFGIWQNICTIIKSLVMDQSQYLTSFLHKNTPVEGIEPSHWMLHPMSPVRVNHDYIVDRLIYPDLRYPMGLLCNTFRPLKVLGLCPTSLWQLAGLWCIRLNSYRVDTLWNKTFLWRLFISSKNKFYGLCHAQSTAEELNLGTPYCADCNLLFTFYCILQLSLYII